LAFWCLFGFLFRGTVRWIFLVWFSVLGSVLGSVLFWVAFLGAPLMGFFAGAFARLSRSFFTASLAQFFVQPSPFFA